MAVNKTDLHPVYYDAVENRPEQLDANYERESRERRVANLRLLWNRRGLAARAAGVGLVLSVVVAFLIPTRFESTARLMPPDQPSSGMGLAMLAAGSAAGGASGSALGSQLGGLGSVAGDLLGIKNSSDLFIGVLQSRTIQDDLINKFDLKKEYSDRRMEDARLDLSTHTDISTDRKTGIITIQVIDHSPQKAAAMAAEYIGELNLVVSQLNTSSAHRERVFLEDRLAQVKEDLESSENRFSEFASNNTAIDVPAQGKAMIEAAATLEGELIAAQTELQGLKQVYSDENVRVRLRKPEWTRFSGSFSELAGSLTMIQLRVQTEISLCFRRSSNSPSSESAMRTFFGIRKSKKLLLRSSLSNMNLPRSRKQRIPPALRFLTRRTCPRKRFSRRVC